jgi:hypothetical protein
MLIVLKISIMNVIWQIIPITKYFFVIIFFLYKITKRTKVLIDVDNSIIQVINIGIGTTNIPSPREAKTNNRQNKVLTIKFNT